ncbi:uncharacterized protein LOC103714413 [Phoenix dactylifera]|uniref:Uncharacterized protein LOC103714413 n=1 Tax=Phoenix dactylifera TaxID=42345 RepID=A0A8B7CIB8_PHODC|nr:uncharacterized protein LOC103714413 [Phoenix dactylifera]
MDSDENGEKKDEIQAALGKGRRDHIPVCVPTVEKELLDQRTRKKRFLDFLKARPSNEWFSKFGSIGRSSPFTFLKRKGNQRDGSSPPDPAPGGRWRHFHVRFVRKINWAALLRYSKNWAKHPMHMALLVWLFFVAAGIIMLFLLMTGLLNGAIPNSSQRKRWTEITNQILNALFTILCLYEHPKLFHHLVLLCKWRSSDTVELRQVYCKTGARRRYERAQMMLVVVLLHITCLCQYAMCALYWVYTRKTRPDWAVNLLMGLGIAAPVIAGLYVVYSPLGRKYESETDEESQREVAMASKPEASELKQYSRRVVVTSPEWVGGLFDCWDDLTVAYLSFFCTFCVFGWNMERLGFGNMYVHIVTFMLLCLAPFWVFYVSALNIEDDVIRDMMRITGGVLCFLGLLYGGFWRTRMRKRFKLPGNPFCCGYPNVTDFMRWLFCWSCSLAQEVRTANFYDIEEDSFHRKEMEEESCPGLQPLPREGGLGPLVAPSHPILSNSSPAKDENSKPDSNGIAADCTPDDSAITTNTGVST